MKYGTIRSSGLIGLVAVFAMIAAACGGGGAASEGPEETPAQTETGETNGSTSGAEPEESTASDWDAVVAAAQEEGEVTIYSSQDPSLLEEIGQRMQELYGITVNVARDVDTTNAQRVQAEHDTGSLTADILVSATEDIVDTHAEAGWVAPPVGPAFASDEYDSSQLHENGVWEVSSALVVLGWNTDVVPEGLESYEDAINDDYANGQVGVLDPSVSNAVVDWWVWAEENFGEDFISGLADLDPRIYNSSLPMVEALVSGEIAVGTYVVPSALNVQQEQGAPVDYVVTDPLWGAHFYGEIFEQAPNPNAAQVLANYLVTREGQEIIARAQASVLPDVEGALAYNPDVRYIDQELQTDEFIGDYVSEWQSQFQ